MNTRAGFPVLIAAALAAGLALGGCNNKTPEVAGTMAPPASSGVAAAAPTGGPNVSDVDVNEHVKTALQRSDSLKGFDIQVVTLKGDVRLIGAVDTQAQIDEALKIARAADGAHTIHDELTIKMK